MKKPFFVPVAIFTILVFGFPSCQDDFNCGGVGPYYYDAKVTGFEINWVTEFVSDAGLCKAFLGHNRESSCFIPYRGGYVFAKDSLHLYVKPFIESKMAVSEQKANQRNTGGFIPAAYACSPLEIPQTDQRLEEIYISSSEDFDPEHPAGSNLVDLFSVLTDDYGVVPIPELIVQDPDLFLLEYNLLKIQVNPDQQRAHVFTFEVVLNDTSFMFKSDTLKLK